MIAVRSYTSLTQEDKEKIYSLARAGVSDDVLCSRYRVDEAMLLRIYDEVLCELQVRRGYRGQRATGKEFYRDCE